ncbi:hypothetical protein VPFG_00264 [Vibrio phage nt-1]|uniref:Uncharacterized protein n=1 Tax=Vibrio phage nt-1 TaxID=115992 RepID=R9TGN2_9CAUD|nr:hypothetical protein VPFG_00264 [Vibrio phage nt-1]AGN30263.1 hypothetical protein VPFG_00264 [Vibrio phage nt-1]
MKIIKQIKEYFFPTIIPPQIGDKFRRIEHEWIDPDESATIIEIVNVSKDGKHIKYVFVAIDGNPVVQTFAGNVSNRTSHDFPTAQLYRLFEKVE